MSLHLPVAIRARAPSLTSRFQQAPQIRTAAIFHAGRLEGASHGRVACTGPTRAVLNDIARGFPVQTGILTRGAASYTRHEPVTERKDKIDRPAVLRSLMKKIPKEVRGHFPQETL